MGQPTHLLSLRLGSFGAVCCCILADISLNINSFSFSSMWHNDSFVHSIIITTLSVHVQENEGN